MGTQVRVLTLDEGEHREKVLYRLQKGWILRFVLGPTLLGRNVHIFTNHPKEGTDFRKHDSTEFRELAWTATSKHKHDTLDSYADVQIWLAGPFSYFFVYDLKKIKEPRGSGFYQVAPTLTVGFSDEVLPLDCVQCQTVLAKLLGSFDTWESRLQVSKESGYNMIHMTPTQELGESNSSYSIADQLSLNPLFNSTTAKYSYDDVTQLMIRMRKEWSLLTVSDVVWNHTSITSKWIQEHPECGYNLDNSRHLRPAYIHDRALLHFSNDIAAGKYVSRGLPPEINHDGHLEVMRRIIVEEMFPMMKFHEFFQVHVDKLAAKFAQEIEHMQGPYKDPLPEKLPQLTIVQDPDYRRLGSTVNMSLALMTFNHPMDCSEAERRKLVTSEFRTRLTELNNEVAEQCWHDLNAAANALCGHVHYERVAGHGPRYPIIDDKHPLVANYFFSKLDKKERPLRDEEAMMYSDNCKYILACNGWVMGDDPLKNFAEPPSKVYFRREVIIWGDNIKLRYGEKPEDCPYLWDHMKKYTEITARTFHGIRIDNCHSTPMHVAEYLLHAARRINPELYVVAELFTGSEDIDNIFVNRLGINSLIREAQSAGDAHEEGRLVYKYGGEPVGAFIQNPIRPIAPSIAHAMFVDQTHDNPSPIQTRTPMDLFPSAALVSMACCATGSNRGYDELVPHHIHVVTESRLYPSWSESKTRVRGEVNVRTGIISGKNALNKLHYELGAFGYSQVFVDQVTEDVVAVTRHNPETHQSVIMVARTAFSQAAMGRRTFIAPLQVSGVIDEIIFEGRMVFRERKSSGSRSPKSPTAVKVFSGSTEFIVGLSEYALEMREHVKLFQSEMVELISSPDSEVKEIDFSNFPAGSAICFRVSLRPGARKLIANVRQGLLQLGYIVRSLSGTALTAAEVTRDTTLRAIVKRMSLVDLNRALFRCHEEEADEGHGGGTYGIPGFSNFVYCGLHGMILMMSEIRLKNDLGHPVCNNLRQGNWLAEYIVNRLNQNSGNRELGKWFAATFEHLYSMPHYLKPCYFDAIISGAYAVLRETAISKMSEFVKCGSSLVQALALTSLIFVGNCHSALLPPLSPNIDDPQPPTTVNEETGAKETICPSLSAGLPHFSCGIFRNWGRDTFIALPGLLLHTGRYDEARYIILAFGGCLRHGLIPNLLGSGTHARFNCRDAVWWWLNCIKIYCELAPNGYQLLKDKVRRLYPNDSDAAGTNDREEPLENTMQEALNRHFSGISYRERNAGHQIDEHMRDEGFNIEAGIKSDSGFVYGGNEWNCGTWMDKMGSSEKAMNRGKPATPRDGSAVELVGLCYSIVKWLGEAHKNKHYSYAAVSHNDGKSPPWSWNDWATRLRKNFEYHFWIPEDKSAPLPPTIDPKVINRRGIYKDSFGATQFWADYQFRPNFPIAVTVAPDLFDPEHAWIALNNAEETLLGPLGMRTLNPSDMAYDGNYINSDDGFDGRRARGFNYHQGPEWVWVVGYFLRAKLTIAHALKLKKKHADVMNQTAKSVQRILSRHFTHIHDSPWGALPELTNQNGSYCHDSCSAQAWSSATIMEALHDLNRFGNL